MGLPTEQRFQIGVLGAELQELPGRCRQKQQVVSW